MDSWLSENSAGLELHGADVAQFRMPSARVVEALDVVEHLRAGFIAGAVNLAVDALEFQGREEALHGRIVPDVPGPAHRTGDAVVGQQALKLLAGVCDPWSE